MRVGVRADSAWFLFQHSFPLPENLMNHSKFLQHAALAAAMSATATFAFAQTTASTTDNPSSAGIITKQTKPAAGDTARSDTTRIEKRMEGRSQPTESAASRISEQTKAAGGDTIIDGATRSEVRKEARSDPAASSGSIISEQTKAPASTR